LRPSGGQALPLGGRSRAAALRTGTRVTTAEDSAGSAPKPNFGSCQCLASR